MQFEGLTIRGLVVPIWAKPKFPPIFFQIVL